jgi:hypothetical protein
LAFSILLLPSPSRDPSILLDGNGGLNLKDPLQVPDWPITRSRVKKMKEAMQGLVQSIWAEFANLSSKTLTFKLGLKEEEPTLIHVV